MWFGRYDSVIDTDGGQIGGGRLFGWAAGGPIGAKQEEAAPKDGWAPVEGVVIVLGQAQGGQDKDMARFAGLAAGVLPGGVPIGEEAIYVAAGLGVMDEVFWQNGLKLPRLEIRMQGWRQDEGDASQTAGLLFEEVEGEQAAKRVGGAFEDETAGRERGRKGGQGGGNGGLVVLAQDVESANDRYSLAGTEGQVEAAEPEAKARLGIGLGRGDAFGVDFDSQNLDGGVEALEAAQRFHGGDWVKTVAEVHV